MLSNKSNDELMKLRAEVEAELRLRGLATVGEVGELAAIKYFNDTPGLHNLQKASTGTKNIDALSLKGDRYAIKTICKGNKTGQVYPDDINNDEKLFEFILVNIVDEEWKLREIYQFSWEKFIEVRSWDKRMKAWYICKSNRVMTPENRVFPSTK